MQMDKLINDANVEIEMLHQRLAGTKMQLFRFILTILTTSLGMQIDQDKLRSENTSLVAAFREKSRKHQQTQELYDRLKRKEMTSVTQTAAYNSVDEVLGSVSNLQGQNQSRTSHQYQTGLESEEDQPVFNQAPLDYHGGAQPHDPSRMDSNGSNGDSRMMPPPSNRTKKNDPKAPDIGIIDHPDPSNRLKFS